MCKYSTDDSTVHFYKHFGGFQKKKKCETAAHDDAVSTEPDVLCVTMHLDNKEISETVDF